MHSRAENEANPDAIAAHWVVRGLSPDLSELELLELADWLETSEDNAEAYAEALRVWSELPAPRIEQTLKAATPEEGTSLVQQLSAGLTRLEDRRTQKQAQNRRVWIGGGLSAIAASIALFVVWPHMTPQTPFETYTTAKGQRQELTLSDGTNLRLNTDTQVAVQITPTGRKVRLEHGEIGLSVVHDEKRPFTVEAGDVTATDIGTQFNVRRTDQHVRVAVTEGEVEMGASGAPSQQKRLKRGDMGVHREGSPTLSLIRVNPDDVFAWTRAHAIYRNETLGEVVKDLNRYFETPILVDERVAGMRLTAILTLDSEATVVGRLKDYLSLDATSTEQGIILHQSAKSGAR